MDIDLEILDASSVAVVGAYGIQIAGNIIIGVNSNSSAINGAQTYVQPDGVTFAVWGLIYALLLVFVIFQLVQGCKGADQQWLNNKTRGLACASFLLNTFWLWLNKECMWWLSVAELISYTAVLGLLYRSLNVAYGCNEHAAPLRIQVCVFAGVSANFAWSVPAAVINFTNAGLYVELGIHTGPTYAILVIAGVAILASSIAATRGDVVYLAVSAWALSGIARFQTHGSPHFHRPLSHQVVVASYIAIGAVVLSYIGGVVYRCMRPSSEDSTSVSDPDGYFALEGHGSKIQV